MMKGTYLAIVCVCLTSAGFGQSRFQFRSMESFGLAAGEAGNVGQVQTVNGVARGAWFLGAGAGIDYYRFRSVPLFLSATRDLAIGKRDWLFLYLDGGTNYPWYKRPEGQDYSYTSSVFHTGTYWSGGFGYLWKLGEHTSKAVLLSAGYTVKKLTETQIQGTDCMYIGACQLQVVNYEYLNRMYLFLIGFRF